MQKIAQAFLARIPESEKTAVVREIALGIHVRDFDQNAYHTATFTAELLSLHPDVS